MTYQSKDRDEDALRHDIIRLAKMYGAVWVPQNSAIAQDLRLERSKSRKLIKPIRII